jgi:alpha-glucosidase
MGRFYGTGDELHLAFNFTYIHAPFAAEALAEVVAESELVIPDVGWPVWTVSNHDVSRVMTRWCGGNERKLRCVLLSLLTLRGTPVMYYGDEIGMPDTPIRKEDLLDPMATRGGPASGRDPERTPMQWLNSAGAGFSKAGVRPWLPIGDAAARNVEEQRRDPRSTLCFVRDLIMLRRRSADLHAGGYTQLDSPKGTWVWRRGDGTTVALNLSDRAVRIPALSGRILIETSRRRDGERLEGGLQLEPWEGAVCSSGST